MKIKVLHVINSLDPGGAEILLTNSLSPGGLSEHTENHLAFFMAPTLVEKLDKKVHVHFLDYKGGKDIFRLLKQLRRIIIENEIDIVHSHLNPAGTYTHIACPSNVPHVHTIHTTYSMDKETSRFKLWTERMIYLRQKKCNLIFLSDFTRQDFLQHVSFKGRAFVLNNFVPDAFFRDTKRTRIRQKPFKVVAVGALRLPKNFEYLLEIFKHLKNEPIVLDIFGAGNAEPYEKVIKKNNLAVRMMGHTANVPDIITGYDLFIMSSRFEGFPLSVFEAMASGVPLMLSDIAPLRSIIREHAIYFELDNAPKAAAQLRGILEGKIDIDTMADKAVVFASVTAKREIYINNLLRIYKELLIS
ncbi:MAG TPA: glycosyltransferase family 4 protein [Ferruginibacter sp.]|nr:glycosyltransferase family 4 protein [Ferruginibacter sp.]